MKILFITTEGFDTPGPNNQMAMTMINDFLEEGFEVHLVQSRRTKINPDIPELIKDKQGFSCDIINRKVIDKSRFINRYIDEMKYAFQSFKYWRKVKNVNVIFLQSCPTVVYQLMLLKVFSKKPIIYNIYDVFPGHAYDIGVMKSKVLYEILQLIQKISYKLSTVITVLSEDMKKKVGDQGVNLSKVRVIPAWYDDRAVKEINDDENRFIKKYKISTDKFVVQFAGTIGYVFNYKAILEAAEGLIDYKDVIFQIIGDGNVKEKFVEEAKRRNLNNIEFYPLQPIEIVPDVYSACSVCVIPLNKGVIGNGVPSKAPLLMACRRVIINVVEKDSEYFRMFKENNVGISVSNDDHKALTKAILDLYNNPEKLKKMADSAQKFGNEHYSSSKNTRKFIDLFYELIKETKNV
ncbi:glycosyltransferase family 4 protein [Fusibacter ferrireducens]|uniref:Glycosyltransferase family 4 protein n=1 Tax=Fusibacter ferrireducens TaxID=2785058 RepID=A0ABR9ZXF2_9FIRM|nr:glycosyltransferase family 4 protein [Fusibacter ferrireducens]MBF4695143.1 glycosyltransferase family 4 protein [Fusibacter ferrireducens]